MRASSEVAILFFSSAISDFAIAIKSLSSPFKILFKSSNSWRKSKKLLILCASGFKSAYSFEIDIYASLSSIEIGKIKGRQSNEIERILGYSSKTEVVHKDDMVKL